MLALVTAISASGGSGQGASLDRSAGAASAGSRAPPFELVSLDGRHVSLTSFRGRPVVINFWASWCNPCRREFPLLKQARAKHHQLTILGVTFRDIAADSRAFAKAEHADWTMLEDPDHVVADAYRVRSVPTTFFVGRNGKIALRYLSGLTRAQLDDGIARILR